MPVYSIYLHQQDKHFTRAAVSIQAECTVVNKKFIMLSETPKPPHSHQSWKRVTGSMNGTGSGRFSGQTVI